MREEVEKGWVPNAQAPKAMVAVFTSAPKHQQVHCRLVVHRVQHLSPREGRWSG